MEARASAGARHTGCGLEGDSFPLADNTRYREGLSRDTSSKRVNMGRPSLDASHTSMR